MNHWFDPASPTSDPVAPITHTADGVPQESAAPLGELPNWDLSALYTAPDKQDLWDDLARAEKDAADFARDYQGSIEAIAAATGAGARLAESVKRMEALHDLIGRISAYAYLNYVTDTADPARAKLLGDVQDKLTAITSKLVFYSLELNQLDDATLERAISSDPALAHYRPWLEDLRKEKPYQLSQDLELLFHDKSVTSRSAWSRLFNETIAALRFDVDGEQLSLEPTLTLLTNPDESKRRMAAHALAKVFRENSRLFTLVTNTLAKDKEIADRWRGFDDVAASRHLSNRVEPEVVDALVEAVRGKYSDLSHRYYAMKARWLGKERLDYWDRNAPLPHTPDRVLNWDEAREIVLGAYNGFSPEFGGIAERFFDKNWIDAPATPSKAPGAFSHPTVPSAHPFILLNYLGKPRDVMTLAHELGHGVHQVLANDQGALMARTPLTLAETASVFGEMLTFRALLERTPSPEERHALLAQKVEDMINTVVRQIAFYIFERRIHTERREHGELTAERIGEIWLEVQGESLGEAVRLGEGYDTYWSYVPHFIGMPFYVYAYAFGDCLVNSLYAVYENADSGFQERYMEMLRAGGTKHHSELLAPFGLDARQPDFWQMGLGVIEGMIDEIERTEAGIGARA
ncbi:MAG: M3 family oligoendopeptidase [Dichotomicrobium sp.]